MDLLLIPVQLLIIGVFVFRLKILDRFPELIKKMYSDFAKDMKFEIGNKWKTLLIPIIVSVSAYVAWVMYNKHFFNVFPLVPINDPLFILDSAILAPIAEQIIQGFLLTAFLALFIAIYKNKWIISIFCFVALMISAYLMAEAHLNPAPINWLLRFFMFMIYGALYYLNERNLLPSIVAHSVWNIILLNQIPL